MKLLSISPYPVYPQRFGGQNRIFNLAKHLGLLGNEVHLAYNHSGFGDRIEGEVEGVNLRPFRTYVQDFGHWLNSKGVAPLIITYPIHELIGSRFKSLFNGYDAVQFEHPFLACWMEHVPAKTLKVYSSHNVERDFEGAYNDNRRLGKFFQSILIRSEFQALKKSDLIVAVTKEDRTRLSQLYQIPLEKIHVIPNGFDNSENRSYNSREVRRSLELPLETKVATFIGSDTPQNNLAVMRIIQDIAPRSKNVLFMLLGASSEKFKEKVGNVVGLGEVNDPNPYLSAADVGLLPIMEGSGSSLKLLHYLSRGLGVVSTPFGLRGFEDLASIVNIGDIQSFPELISISERRSEETPPEIYKYSWANLASDLDKVIRRYIPDAK